MKQKQNSMHLYVFCDCGAHSCLVMGEEIRHAQTSDQQIGLTHTTALTPTSSLNGLQINVISSKFNGFVL